MRAQYDFEPKPRDTYKTNFEDDGFWDLKISKKNKNSIETPNAF